MPIGRVSSAVMMQAFFSACADGATVDMGRFSASAVSPPCPCFSSPACASEYTMERFFVRKYILLPFAARKRNLIETFFMTKFSIFLIDKQNGVCYIHLEIKTF